MRRSYIRETSDIISESTENKIQTSDEDIYKCFMQDELMSSLFKQFHEEIYEGACGYFEKAENAKELGDIELAKMLIMIAKEEVGHATLIHEYFSKEYFSDISHNILYPLYKNMIEDLECFKEDIEEFEI